MSRLCLYFKQAPERDRWIAGDRFVRPVVRRIMRGAPLPSGVDKVFSNLCLGLKRIGAEYVVNLPFNRLRKDDKVAVMGRGPSALDGYNRENRIVAGPYLMTHPSEWPTLCDEFPIARYLQHCQWATDIYKPYFGDRCFNWAHGVDTGSWKPSGRQKEFDFLVYDKVRWNREYLEPNLIQPIRETLGKNGLTFAEVRYGFYREPEYRDLLARSRGMIFLVEHESQGSACQECLACDVPIFAWNQGWYLDPNQSTWGQPRVPASSVPYFDERCGMTFRELSEFEENLDRFLNQLNAGGFAAREYILRNLTVEKCAQRYLDILPGVNNE